MNILTSDVSPHALVLSPHFDDACLSLGGFLLKQEFKSLCIVTVFSKSEHAPALKLLVPLRKVDQLGMNPFRETTRSFVALVRQREDARFCSKIKANQFSLSFSDSSLRGYAKPNRCKWDSIGSEPIYHNVLEAIQSILHASWDMIFCPLAIGNHVDHLIVSHSFLKIVKETKMKHAFFYEDLPYASNYSLGAIETLVASRIGHSEPVLIDITGSLNEKNKLVSVYKSQDDEKMKKSISNHAERFSSKNMFFERVWHCDN